MSAEEPIRPDQIRADDRLVDRARDEDTDLDWELAWPEDRR